MPRQLRIQYEGAIYHLMNRGDQREEIEIKENIRNVEMFRHGHIYYRRPKSESQKKEKKATKMVDIFVLIVGASELPKFTKIQLVIGSSKNI
jgi:hypothetical protein